MSLSWRNLWQVRWRKRSRTELVSRTHALFGVMLGFLAPSLACGEEDVKGRPGTILFGEG